MLSRSARRSLLLGATALLLGCGLLVLMLSQLAGRETELLAARNRWATRSFKRYRLTVEEHGNFTNCRYDVEVQDEQVVSAVVTSTNDLLACDQIPTVTRLFDRLSVLDGQCGPNGCACDGPIQVDAIYDARLGYPHFAATYLGRVDRWRYPGAWNPFRICTLGGFLSTEIRVLSLTPLP